MTPILEELVRVANEGKTVAILTACAYQVDPTVRALMKRGAPFHNRHRPDQRRWNPLKRSTGSTLGAIFRFLSPSSPLFGQGGRSWSWIDIAAWAELLRPDVFAVEVKEFKAKARDEAKRCQEQREKTQPVKLDELEAIFRHEEDCNEACLYDLDWLWQNAREAVLRRQIVRYYVKLTQRYGVTALITRELPDMYPRITVGTIHSVKGAEFDIVYVFPDLSRQGYDEMQKSVAGRNATLRQFYVGCTRSKEVLVLCAPSTRRHFPWPSLK